VLAPGENIQLHEGNHVESTTERDSAFAAVKMMRRLMWRSIRRATPDPELK